MLSSRPPTPPPAVRGTSHVIQREGEGQAAVCELPTPEPDNSSGTWEVEGVWVNSGGPLGFRGGRGPSRPRVQGALHAGGSTGPLSWTWARVSMETRQDIPVGAPA